MHEMHFEPALARRDLEVLDAVQKLWRARERRFAQRIDAARRLADVRTAHDVTWRVKLALRLVCVASTM